MHTWSVLGPGGPQGDQSLDLENRHPDLGPRSESSSMRMATQAGGTSSSSAPCMTQQRTRGKGVQVTANRLATVFIKLKRPNRAGANQVNPLDTYLPDSNPTAHALAPQRTVGKVSEVHRWHWPPRWLDMYQCHVYMTHSVSTFLPRLPLFGCFKRYRPTAFHCSSAYATDLVVSKMLLPTAPYNVFSRPVLTNTAVVKFRKVMQ